MTKTTETETFQERVVRERAEKAQREQDALRAAFGTSGVLLRAVRTKLKAKGLDATVQVQRSDDELTVTFNDGLVVTARTGIAGWRTGGDDNGRLDISPTIKYQTLRYNESTPSASIKASRGPKALATAIVKILPESIELWKREQDYAASKQKREDLQRDVAGRLQEALGVSPRVPYGDRSGTPTSEEHKLVAREFYVDGAGTVTAHTDKWVELNLRVDAELAIAISKIIRKHNERKGS